MNLTDFSLEILMIIFEHFDIEELIITISHTCSIFRQIVQQIVNNYINYYNENDETFAQNFAETIFKRETKSLIYYFYTKTNTDYKLSSQFFWYSQDYYTREIHNYVYTLGTAKFDHFIQKKYNRSIIGYSERNIKKNTTILVSMLMNSVMTNRKELFKFIIEQIKKTEKENIYIKFCNTLKRKQKNWTQKWINFGIIMYRPCLCLINGSAIYNCVKMTPKFYINENNKKNDFNIDEINGVKCESFVNEKYVKKLATHMYKTGIYCNCIVKIFNKNKIVEEKQQPMYDCGKWIIKMTKQILNE